MFHFISTRSGGVSKPPFDTLNISFNVPDEPKNVLYNRNLLAQALGIKLGNMTTAKQVHGNKVAIITKELCGRGAKDHASALDGIDAMVTNCPNICIIVQVADCVPILLFDPSRRVVGVVHAGWRGTVLNIAGKTVKSMIKKFRSNPRNILAGIGPSIGPCCYEVGKEVLDHDVPAEIRDGKSYFDLWEANKKQLADEGIPFSNIEVSRICTKCNSDKFFSARAGKGLTGRFGAGIMLK